MQVPPLVISLAFGWQKYARLSIRTSASSSAARTMAHQCGPSVESKYGKTCMLQGTFEPPFGLRILLSCLSSHSIWMAKASDRMLHSMNHTYHSCICIRELLKHSSMENTLEE